MAPATEHRAPSLRRALKRLRSSQPFNRIATSSARGVLSLLGQRSERLIRHLHRVGLVESRLPNGRVLKLWSHADDWVSNQVYWRGWIGYEPETAPLFYELAMRSRVTLDVGAHVGFFALLAAHANPAGRVYAFEPLPEAYARLRENVARNGVTNLIAVPDAVGALDDEGDFFHISREATREVASDGEASIPCSSSLSAEFMRGRSGLVSSRVRIRTLDRFLGEAQVSVVDLVKIDTESTEVDVLEGLRETLAASRPAIVCEVLPGSGTGARLLELLVPLGYRAYLLTPAGPRLVERVDGHTEWMNHLFTRQPADEVLRLHLRALERAGVRQA